MNVLIIGSGGREHAIAWKISKSSMIKKLIVCPGNAGTELVAQNIELDINDFKKIQKLLSSFWSLFFRNRHIPKENFSNYRFFECKDTKTVHSERYIFVWQPRGQRFDPA